MLFTRKLFSKVAIFLKILFIFSSSLKIWINLADCLPEPWLLLRSVVKKINNTPAKAAAAAESDGPQMYKTLKLYVGGDVTGNYPEQR